MIMSKSNVVLAAIFSWSLLAVTSRAQETNAYAPVPTTKLEALEANTGTVIIKGFAPVGSISVSGEVVSVTCKEDTDIGTGRKEYGIAITIRPNNKFEDRMIVDYDELDSLINAIDYLSRIDWGVTSLPSFNAAYTTKSGFRISALCNKLTGKIEVSIRSSRTSKGAPVPPTQLAQFRALIDQAKSKLDSLRAGK